MDARTDGRTDGRKVITIAHPEQSSGELKTCGVRTLSRIYQGTNEYYRYVMLFSYSIYINNIIFIGLSSNLQNFRFHVKCSVFVSSTCDMQNLDRNLLNE